MRAKGFTLIELLIVVAIIAILAAIAVPNFLEAQVRSKVSRVKADQRSLATALESYYIDNNGYPEQDSSGGTADGFGANALPNASGQLLAYPTFRRKQNNTDQLHTLTTPISYITSLFPDPFAKTPGAIFCYSRPDGILGPEVVNSGWIVWSWGPDVDESQITSPGKMGCDLTAKPPAVADTYYNPRGVVPSPTLIDQATYDPTNGTTSHGDVYRYKQ